MKKAFSSLIFSLACLASAMLCFSFNTNTSPIMAETISVPDYFSVKTNNGTSVVNGGTIYLANTQSITIGLNLENSVVIDNTVSTEISINNLPLSTTDRNKMVDFNPTIEGYIANDPTKNSYGIFNHEETTSYYFKFDISASKIFSNTREDSGKLYGKIDLTFLYHVVDNGLQEKTFNYTFFLLKKDDYDSTILAMQNAVQLGATTSYSKSYQYKYQTQQLPTVTYDPTKFDVSITKTSGRKGVQTLSLTYRNNQLTKTGDATAVFATLNQNNKVKLVFPELSEYVITYTRIHQIGTNIYVLKNETALLNDTTTEKLTITGFALYYSVAGSLNEVAEFNNKRADGTLITNTDFTYLNKTTPAEVIVSYNALNIPIASTNQAPLQYHFTSSVNIKNGETPTYENSSWFWKLKGSKGAYQLDNANGTPLENTYFSERGKYLVKMISGVDVQWFIFEITANVPTISLKTTESTEISGRVTEGTFLSSGYYTNKNVIVNYETLSSRFDAPSTLTVERYAYNRTTLQQTTIVTEEQTGLFTENGYYVVTLNYGGGSNTKAYFYIDKNNIENYSLFNVSPTANGRYSRTSNINFLTNQPIAMMFSSKASGASVSAEYKYFALENINEDYFVKFNNEYALENFYNSLNDFSIPVLNTLSYSQDIQTIGYSQPTNSANISRGSVLNDAGLYIFRLVDIAGNETYTCVFIDNSTPVILQKDVSGHFTKVTALNMVSANTNIYWGKNKIIELTNVNVGAISTDPWFGSVYSSYNSYIAQHTFAGNLTTYLQIPIDQTIYCAVGDSTATTISANQYYGATINAVDANGNPNEQQYIYYVRDASNTKTASTPLLTYTTYPSVTHNITVNFDAAKMSIFGNKGNEFIQSNYSTIDTANSKKLQYFAPTNALTFGDDKKVKTSFVASPSTGVVEVEEVICEFYPLIETELNVVSGGNDGQPSSTRKIQNVYDYSSTPTLTTTIYKRNFVSGVTEINLATEINGVYEWIINQYYDNETASYKTREGKYVLSRKYHIFEETRAQVTSNKDYIERELIFYVDSNRIVEMETSSGEYIVGGGIKLKITNDYFTKISLAENYNSKSKHASANQQGSIESILTTNKLPVVLNVPIYKYGVVDGVYFLPSPNANFYDSSKTANSAINYNKLNVKIYRYNNIVDVSDTSVAGDLIYPLASSTYDGDNNGYIDTPELQTNGFYEIVVYENDPKAPEFVFVFEIRHESPSFSLTTTANVALGSHLISGTTQYYTNKDIIRVNWNDNASEYMAKIDPSKIGYKLYYNNGSADINYTYITMPIDETTKTEHYYDIDLNSLGLTQAVKQSISRIDISAQYYSVEGKTIPAYFTTTKTIIIDKTAPSENINRLIQNAGLTDNYNQIRKSNGTNNVSATDGIFRHFAYAVDRSELRQLINISNYKTAPLEGYDVWFRKINKYDDSVFQETDPAGFVGGTEFRTYDETSITNNMDEINRYYEIVEKDLAGNITIYTIYLTDYSNENELKRYISFDGELINKQDITRKNINKNITTYTKTNFFLTDVTFMAGLTNITQKGYPWYYIDVNETRYFHTPYNEENNLYYFDALSQTPEQPKTATLKDITTLGVKPNMQVINIANVPYLKTVTLNVGVLAEDRRLNYIHLSGLGVNQNDDGTYSFVVNNREKRVKEAIAVEIPANAESTASVYCVNLDIKYGAAASTLYSTSAYLSDISVIQELEEDAYIEVFLYTSSGRNYAIFSIKEPANNTYYIYLLKDNFGQTYYRTSIYGAESANEEWQYKDNMIEKTENGKEWVYATKNIMFEFNSSKDCVAFTVMENNNPRTYYSNNTDDLAILMNAENSVITGILLQKVRENSSVYRVTLSVLPTTTPTNGLFGGYRDIIVNISPNLDFDIGVDETLLTQEKNVRLYNVVPQINLFGNNNEDLNDIFEDSSLLVGAPITIKFASSASQLYPNVVYLKNNNTNVTAEITSGYIVPEAGDYTVIIGYKDLFTGETYYTYKNFVLYNNAVDTYKVFKYDENGNPIEAKETGNTYSYTDAGNTIVVYSHYIVNSQYSISCNEAQKVSAGSSAYKVITGTNNIRTYVWEITNKNEEGVNSNINYFRKLIAITVVPKTSMILSSFINIEDDETSTTLYTSEAPTSVNTKTFSIEKSDTKNSTLRFSWNAYFGLKENLIDLILTDSDDNKVLNPEITTRNNVRYVTLDSSGRYNFKFVDKAGNEHFFGDSNTYRITFVSSVLFRIKGINDEQYTRPINNAIYDGGVDIMLPTTSRTLYDSGVVPTINVERNGVKYSMSDKTKMSYKFTEPGLYKVSFSAVVNTKPLREEVITFTIINANETRWAYEFQEYSSYYISKLVKNGIEVSMEDIVARGLGKPINVMVNEIDDEGNVLLKQKTFVKNILISLYDEQTGVGDYKLTVKTNDLNNATFEFSFKIKNVIPPINVSVPEGTKTKEVITVTYNAFNLHEQVGDCILKVADYSETINAETLAEVTGVGNRTLPITVKGTYYIQLYSLSGSLLYSYRVDKVDPLNTVSIILIVVGVLVFIGLIILFVIMRKRMRIR